MTSDPSFDELLEREQHLRLRMAHEHLALSDEVKAQRRELEEVHAALREARTEIHELHGRLTQSTAEIQRRHADLEVFSRRLAAAERSLQEAESRIQAEAQLTWWDRLQGRKARLRPMPSTANAVPPVAARYFLHTSPFRLFRESSFVLRGWAWPEDGRAVIGIRARVDGQAHQGTIGLPEPDAVRVHSAPANAALPGFLIEIPTPPGRHELSLELELGPEGWFVFLATPIWSAHD